MSGGTVLRPPRAGEAAALTALCLRSKAHWGYDEAFMAACRSELTIAEDDLDADSVAVAEIDGGVAAMAEIALDGRLAELEKLFVEPAFMGRGLGRLLFDWALRTARAGGAWRMTIDADPDAVAFYRRCGAIPAGETPSGSIAGRMLPRLEIDLA